MRKFAAILFVCALLSGCSAFVGKKTELNIKTPDNFAKATVNYKIAGGKSPKNIISCGVFSKYIGADNKEYAAKMPENKYFNVIGHNTDFTIYMDIDGKDCSASPMSILAIATLGVFPVRMAKGEIVIKPVLFDNRRGMTFDLPETAVSESVWSGWPLLPFSKGGANGDIIKAALQDLAPDIYAAAAAIAYDKTDDVYDKGVCIRTVCSLNKMKRAKTVSAQDISFAAYHAASLKDFEEIKSKGVADDCPAVINLMTNEKGIISKEQKMYWQLLDFYINNCGDFRKKLDCETGITKDGVIQCWGTPTSAYKLNGDTEILEYKSSKIKGEDVETSKMDFILDRGILTKIK